MLRAAAEGKILYSMIYKTDFGKIEVFASQSYAEAQDQSQKSEDNLRHIAPRRGSMPSEGESYNAHPGYI